MSRNPVLAQHFGQLPISDSRGGNPSALVQPLESPYPPSDEESSSSSEYDAGFGFSHFGSTSYRTITKFVPSGNSDEVTRSATAHNSARMFHAENNNNNDNDTLPPTSSSLALPINAASPDEHEPQHGARRRRSSSGSSAGIASSSHSPARPVTEPQSTTPSVMRMAAISDTEAETGFSDFMRHSKSILEDATRLCEASRRQHNTYESSPSASTHHYLDSGPMGVERAGNAQPQGSIARNGTVIPQQSSSCSLSQPVCVTHLDYSSANGSPSASADNPSRTNELDSIPGVRVGLAHKPGEARTSTTDSSPALQRSALGCPGEAEAADRGAADPKRILLSLSTNPSVMVARRLGRRPPPPPTGRSKPTNHTNLHVAEQEKSTAGQRVGRERFPQRKAERGEERRAVSPHTRQTVSHEPDLISMNSFAVILDKLTAFLNAQNSQHTAPGGFHEPSSLPLAAGVTPSFASPRYSAVAHSAGPSRSTSSHPPRFNSSATRSVAPAAAPRRRFTTTTPTAKNSSAPLAGGVSSTPACSPTDLATVPSPSRTPRGVSIPRATSLTRSSTGPQRGAARGPSRRPTPIPCYALPTQNWLSKHAKTNDTADISFGGFSSGSAGISGD